MRILLAQTDADELDVTAYALHRQDFQVLTTTDGKSTVAKWQSENPDLVILETALPKLSGLEVCRQIRAESEVPIIFLSERSADQDVVAAFNAGADDYVVKPFSANQLIARVRRALRRAAVHRARPDGAETPLQIGGLIIDGEGHRVTSADGEVHLTPLEFRLLYCLAANKGRVIGTNKLIDYAWGSCEGGDTSVLKTHISRIRQKLETANSGCNNIRSVPGVGYCLDD